MSATVAGADGRFHFVRGRCVCSGVDTCAEWMARMSRQDVDGFERAWNELRSLWMVDGLVAFGHGVHWTEGIDAMQHYDRHGGREDEAL